MNTSDEGQVARVRSAVRYVKAIRSLGCIVTDAVRGLLAGVLVAALLAAVDHVANFGSAIVLTPLILVGLLAGAVVGFRRRPDDIRAARALDQRFALADRSTTAFELQSAETPIARLQRADATKHVEDLNLKSSARSSFRLREAAGLPVAAALFLALALTVPTAVHAQPTHSSGDRAKIQKVLHKQLPKAINHAKQLAEQHKQNATLRKLYHQLIHLKRELRKAKNRSQALKQISLTQQALHRLGSGLHPIKPSQAAQLMRALHSVMKTGLHTNHSQSSQNQAASALRQLASSIGHMSAKQRTALAHSLAKAANATKNPSLQSALRQAASSLGYNDPKTAQNALRQAASGLSQSPSQQSSLQQLAQTSNQLQELKGAVTGLGQKPGNTQVGNPGSGKPGNNGKPGNGTSNQGKGGGQGQGQGHGHGSGHGSGQGSGSGSGHGHGHGSGSGSGHGQGNGQGHGSGSNGRGGAGGHGAGGGRGSQGGKGNGHPGQYVYIPGKKANGPHSILRGPNGQPLPGSSVPYREVILQYRSAFRSALDRGSLPPTLQNFVRQYFSSISR